MLHEIDNLNTTARRQRDARDWHNPLRGMTIPRVVALLEAWRRGDTTELMWVFDLIEQLDPVYRAAKHSLSDGVLEFDWDIKTKPDKKMGPSEKAAATRQADTLRREYERIDNLEDALEHMISASFRGAAHCEMWREAKGGNILHLECVPQWHFHKETGSGPWLYDAEARMGSIAGVPLPQEDWLIRNVADPVGPIALICYVRKGLSQKDWDGYLESFGIPPAWAVLPPNLPPGEVDKWLTIMERAISGSRGVLPHGADIKTMSITGQGTTPFQEHLDYQDQLVTLACLSSMLTMLTESGSGTLAGGAHADSVQTVVKGLAKKVSVTFQRKIDKDILARFHPGEPMLAWFQLSYESEPDAGEFLNSAEKVHRIGFTPDPDQITERTSVKILDSPARPLSSAFGRSLTADLTAAVITAPNPSDPPGTPPAPENPPPLQPPSG